MNAQVQLDLLIESLQLLAAPAERQIGELPAFVVVTDEVLSSFGDAFLLLPQLEQVGVVCAAAGTAIRRLDSWLDSAPTDGSIEETSSLHAHPFWERTRELATVALQLIPATVELADLRTTTWKRARKDGDG